MLNIFRNIWGIALRANSLEISKLIKNIYFFLRKNELTGFEWISRRILIGTYVDYVRYVDFYAIYVRYCRSLLTSAIRWPN